jgi:hypothetical protein
MILLGTHSPTIPPIRVFGRSFARKKPFPCDTIFSDIQPPLRLPFSTNNKSEMLRIVDCIDDPRGQSTLAFNHLHIAGFPPQSIMLQEIAQKINDILIMIQFKFVKKFQEFEAWG